MYTERLVSLPSKRAQSAGVGQSPRLAEERRQGRRAAEDVPLKAELPNTADLEDREGKKRAPHKAYEYNKEGRSFHAPLAVHTTTKEQGRKHNKAKQGETHAATKALQGLAADIVAVYTAILSVPREQGA